MVAVGTAAVVAAVAAGAGAFAFRGDQPPDTPVTATPGPPGQPQPATGLYSGLREARTDLARRVLGSDDAAATLRVRLRELKHAGWDGCMGVIIPGRACDERFAAGLIALFDLDGATYRYHLVGGQYIATDFVAGPHTVTDGTSPDPQIQADANALLAEYARGDLALREGADRPAITTLYIIPTIFFNRCNGESYGAGPECEEDRGDRIPGAFVAFRLPDAWAEIYGVSLAGITHYDLSKNISRQAPSMDVGEVQARMREDLATRLRIPIEQIGVASYRAVTWPDGCLGVHRPGAVCTASLTPGFVALLAAPGGPGEPVIYRYHGARGFFIAATFLAREGATLDTP